jgi:hypothetical protein
LFFIIDLFFVKSNIRTINTTSIINIEYKYPWFLKNIKSPIKVYTGLVVYEFITVAGRTPVNIFGKNPKKDYLNDPKRYAGVGGNIIFIKYKT